MNQGQWQVASALILDDRDKIRVMFSRLSLFYLYISPFTIISCYRLRSRSTLQTALSGSYLKHQSQTASPIYRVDMSKAGWFLYFRISVTITYFTQVLGQTIQVLVWGRSEHFIYI